MARENEERPSLWRREWSLAGSVPSWQADRASRVTPIHVSFPPFAADPRVVSIGCSTDTVSLGQRRIVPWAYRALILHPAGVLPIRDEDGLPDETAICDEEGREHSVFDFGSCSAPAALIEQGRLSHRTVFDAPGSNHEAVDLLLGSDSQAARGARTLCNTQGFQTVEVLHPDEITLEAVYVREFDSHAQVPAHLRAARCGRLPREPFFGARSSNVLISESHFRNPRPAGEAPFHGPAEAIDDRLCVCCYRRVLIARLTRPDERPQDPVATVQHDRLARRLAALDLRQSPLWNQGDLPDIRSLNVADDSSRTWRYPDADSGDESSDLSG